MPFAKLRTPAAEPVPGVGLDVPPTTHQLLQLDMDSDFLTRLLGGASSVSECNWATKVSGFVSSRLLQESLEKGCFSSCFPPAVFLVPMLCFPSAFF